MKIDVVIPVYKPGRELFTLLDRLRAQTVPIQRIILMNTEKRYFDELTRGMDFSDVYENVEVHHLSRDEFDHGATRHRGVELSHGEIFVMMTQDAMPENECLVENLISHLRGNVAVAYGRQLPAADCSEAERVSREFNYPEQSLIKTIDDLESLGIKTYFCSNVCAAYRRDLYDELGGFIRHTIFNEDMIFAAKALKKGYGVAYEADARVIHSHNYTCMQQLHRNFDLGVSQTDHPEVFRDIPSESEGKKLIREVWKSLYRKKRLYKFPGFVVQCCFRYTGYLLGKHYQYLPRKLILILTMNREYWR